MIKLKHLVVVLAAFGAAGAQAAGIDLGTYSVAAQYNLAINPGNGVSGLEGSGVTYDWDTGTLVYVGDEGTGAVEVSTTGQTLSTMRFTAWPAGLKGDAEGITYLGNGQYATVDERAQDVFKFSYVAGGSVNLATAPVVNIGPNVGNIGLEGLSYDRRDGSFVTIKQESPENVQGGTLNFSTGASTMAPLFNPSLLGLSTLSDVQTLSSVPGLAGTSFADDLLILSLGSQKLVLADRSGNVLSSFNLSSLDAHNSFEGVTISPDGTIYLVGEGLGKSDPSSLVVLGSTVPVPEPETCALMLAGLGMLGFVARRRNRKALA